MSHIGKEMSPNLHVQTYVHTADRHLHWLLSALLGAAQTQAINKMMDDMATATDVIRDVFTAARVEGNICYSCLFSCHQRISEKQRE